MSMCSDHVRIAGSALFRGIHAGQWRSAVLSWLPSTVRGGVYFGKSRPVVRHLVGTVRCTRISHCRPAVSAYLENGSHTARGPSVMVKILLTRSSTLTVLDGTQYASGFRVEESGCDGTTAARTPPGAARSPPRSPRRRRGPGRRLGHDGFADVADAPDGGLAGPLSGPDLTRPRATSDGGGGVIGPAPCGLGLQ
jgi:hypothetical protein